MPRSPRPNTITGRSSKCSGHEAGLAALGEIGAKVSGKGRNHEPQGTSDAQLRAAQGLLRQASAGLSGKALKHVDNAIAQINDGLSIR